LYAIDKSLNVSESVEKKVTPQDTSDKTPPAEVTDITVTAANGNAVLTWTNPTDSDFAGVKITMTPATGTLAHPVTLDKDVTRFDVSGLIIGEEYSFTIQTFDTSLNYSDGETQETTIADTSDKEAPEDVTDLTVQATNGNAVLTWKNPTDSDFSGVKITMTPAAGTLANPVTLDKTVTTFTVSELTNGTEYTFKVQSFDTSLNYSEGAQNKATPQDTSDKIAPEDVTDFSVSCVNGADGKVNAVLTWTDPSDTDLFGMEVTYAEDSNSRAAIAPMAEGSIFVAPGKGGTVINDLTAGTTYTFTVKSMDTNGNKSDGVSTTETMTLTQLSELKITLTPSTKESTNQAVIVSVTVETPGTVSEIYYLNDEYESYDITSEASFTVEENGEYFVAAVDYDGRSNNFSYIRINNIDKTAPEAPINLATTYNYSKKTITLVWEASYDDDDVDHYLVSYSKDGTPVKTDEVVAEETYTVSDVDVGDTAEEYEFTVKAVDEAGNIGSEATTSVTPNVNDIPTFTSFNIPNAGTSKSGNTITATVIGKKFKGATSEDFTVTCAAADDIVKNAEVTIVSDSKLTVTLTIPGTAGSYNVTITNGSNSKTGTFTVKDYSSYAVGDVILADGTKVDVTNINSYSIDENNKPVAVVAGFNVNGAAIGLGIQKSSLAWAPKDTTGYNTEFTDMIVECSSTFTGDLDGSDNWDVICSVDPEGTKDAATNYPAFNFAATYGTSQGYTGDLATGWYIPSFSELYEVYKNKDTFQTSLSAAGGFTIGSSWYWSSSQSSNYCNDAYQLRFYDGFGTICDKADEAYVLVLRAF
jgi:hypothetical protein